MNPEVMGGAPCIGGLPITVSTLVMMITEGMSYKQILDEVPLLEAEDIDQGLQYAARAIHRFLDLPFRGDAAPHSVRKRILRNFL